MTEQLHDRHLSAAPYLHRLAEQYRMSPARVGVLFGLVDSNDAITDSFSAIQCLERCLQRARFDEGAAAREVMTTGPWHIQQARGDGRQIKLTIPTFTPTKALVSDGSRLRVERFNLQPGCQIRWQHQPGAVADITAAQLASNGDLQVWATIHSTHPDIITAAIYGELSCSPGLTGATARDGYDRYHHERTTTVMDGRTSEISLTLLGNDMLPTTVELGTPPPLAAQAWRDAQPPPTPTGPAPTPAETARRALEDVYPSAATGPMYYRTYPVR